MSEQDRLEINWFNVMGSALGAVSAAVVLSTFGTAGTLIGAAMGSLCVTAGGAIYAHSLHKGKERLAAQALATRRRTRVSPTVSTTLGNQRPDTVETPVYDELGAQGSWKDTLSELPWKRILTATALLFALAMGAILTFELVAGRSVSSYTGGSSQTDGGTSIPGFSGRSSNSGETGNDGQDGTDDQPRQENPGNEGEDQQEEDPQEPEPTQEPDPEPAETPSVPVPTPEPTLPPQ